MMDCEKISDYFGDLYDQHLDGDVEHPAREHLRNCPCCREEFKWYGLSVNSLSELERIRPPEDLLDRLRTNLQATASPPSIFDSLRNLLTAFPQLPLPVGVTALACAAVVAWTVYGYTPTGMAIPQGPTKAASLDARTPPISPSAPSFTPNSSNVLLTSGGSIIGSDSLTVESPSMNQAVEALKRTLPQMQGRLVEEKCRNGVKETTLAVMIPPQAWPNLTTELINHGAVVVGDNSQQRSVPMEQNDSGENVLIRIHIVNTP